MSVAEIYTVGQIAKICHVAPRTVAKWFDQGILKGFKMPVSDHRRVTREKLIVFLVDQGIDIPDSLRINNHVCDRRTSGRPS